MRDPARPPGAHSWRHGGHTFPSLLPIMACIIQMGGSSACTILHATRRPDHQFRMDAEDIRNTYGASVKRPVVIPRGIDLTTRPTSRRIAWHACANIGALPKGSAWFCRLGASPAGNVFLAAVELLERSGRWPQGIRAVVAGHAQGCDDYVTELMGGDQRKRTEPDRPSVGACRRHGGAYRASDIVLPSPDPGAFGRVPPEALYRELIGTPA
jgi:hypothetical protein